MERFGVLQNVRVLGEDLYYKLVVGTRPDGQVNQLVTRGEGRERGAIRIPIGIEAKVAARLVDRDPHIFRSDAMQVLEGLGRGIPLRRMRVYLVQMPRAGNKVSGWEWNAPGGTGEPGETPEQIATREFSEESDLTVLTTGSFLPTWMQFASGCYDEVQTISFALVMGRPQKLVEGARVWTSVSLDRFTEWACRQNQNDSPPLWETPEFVPVDGKVLFATWLLRERLLRRRVTQISQVAATGAGDPAGHLIVYEDDQTAFIPTSPPPGWGWTGIAD